MREFRSMYRNVQRVRKLLGPEARARDIIAEAHLEPGEDV